jgi:ornithine carbamoyltransferase
VSEDAVMESTTALDPPVAPTAEQTAGGQLRGRKILSDGDVSAREITLLLDTAGWLKGMRQRGEPHPLLAGKTLGLIFQHPSTRTRNVFHAGMEQLGGHATFLGIGDLQLTRGETLADTAQIMSRYVDGIAARFASHDDLLTFAAGASVPVYNALTECDHPLEALSDLLTLRERFGALTGLRLAYVGDGNNVCHSLMMSGAAMGMTVAIATPLSHRPDPEVVRRATALAAGVGGEIVLTTDPMAATRDADAVYTDVHESMGQADDLAKVAALAPYRVTAALMAAARPTAVFMHCLPMRRGEEVDAAVADGRQSIVFDQAESRLHLHKAVLWQTLG